MNMKEYVLYKVDTALQDRKHEKANNGETFTTAMKVKKPLCIATHS